MCHFPQEKNQKAYPQFQPGNRTGNRVPPRKAGGAGVGFLPVGCWLRVGLGACAGVGARRLVRRVGLAGLGCGVAGLRPVALRLTACASVPLGAWAVRCMRLYHIFGGFAQLWRVKYVTQKYGVSACERGGVPVCCSSSAQG